jgi:hypothetical protein
VTLAPQVEGVIDLQDRVLGDDAEQHQHPKGGVQVQRIARQVDGQQRERQ